jgi:V8-like Glu-specific endopeptidase
LAASSEDKKEKLHKATVTEASDSILSFEYDDNNLTCNATSGAPIINEKGEVVGVNLGYKQKDGKLIGIANPSASFKKLIVKAIKK